MSPGGVKPEWILRAVTEEKCTIVWLLVPWAQDLLDAIESGGEVDGGVVRFLQGHRRRAGGTEAHKPPAVLGVGWLVPARKEHHAHLGELSGDGVHAADKLRAEDQGLYVRQLQAVFAVKLFFRRTRYGYY